MFAYQPRLFRKISKESKGLFSNLLPKGAQRHHIALEPSIRIATREPLSDIVNYLQIHSITALHKSEARMLTNSPQPQHCIITRLQNPLVPCIYPLRTLRQVSLSFPTSLYPLQTSHPATKPQSKMSSPPVATKQRKPPTTLQDAVVLYGLAFTLLAILPAVASWNVSVLQNNVALTLAYQSYYQGQLSNVIAVLSMCSSSNDVSDHITREVDQLS